MHRCGAEEAAMTNEKDLRDVAREHVRAGTGLIIHATTFFIVNLALVVMWALTGHGYPWFVWLLLFWGIGVVTHAITYRIGPGSANEERAIEREVIRLQSRTQQ
jgi:hypothetical protein